MIEPGVIADPAGLIRIQTIYKIMKKVKRNLMSSFLWVGLGLMALPAEAQQPQGQKPELEGMLLMSDGRRQRGFIQDTSKEGLLFALTERGPGNGYYWDTQVKAVAFDNSNDIMRDARAAFMQGNYEDAVTKFGEIADNYANMAWVPGSFAAEARYYHIESLRRLGRFKEMDAALKTPAAQAIDTKLGDFYKSQHELNKVWAQYGAEQWDAVKTAVEGYQKPQIGNQEMLPTPVFQNMPSREMVQWAFMRAKLSENAGESKKALDDYYLVFNLTFANNPELALPAMEAVMTLHKADPYIDHEKNKTVLRQMQSMAYIYKNGFASGQIPPQFAEFSLKPELPKPPVIKEEEEEEIPAPEPKKMEPEDGEKPAADGDDKEKEAAAADGAKPEPEPEN